MKVLDQEFGAGWAYYNGDSSEVLAGLPDNSVDLSVYSPPFAALYTYSPSERDLGNSSNDDEFFAHFGYIIGEVLRVTKPGRVTCVHVADVPAMLARDGYIGLKDFSGDVIRAYIAAGWTFDARVPIDKNQQAQSIRTHAKGLTMTQMEKDRTWSRPAMPDYILKFRKPGENAVPVNGGDVTRDLWIEYANPTWPGERDNSDLHHQTHYSRWNEDGSDEWESWAANKQDRAADAGAMATWYGIRESDTLQAAPARVAEDERHICPLQLGTIERCIRLWSKAGETVLDPFGGIASTGFEAVRLGRRFVGVELKPSYFKQGVKNLRAAADKLVTPTLFSALEAAVA